jgi:hypothetical protein
MQRLEANVLGYLVHMIPCAKEQRHTIAAYIGILFKDTMCKK